MQQVFLTIVISVAIGYLLGSLSSRDPLPLVAVISTLLLILLFWLGAPVSSVIASVVSCQAGFAIAHFVMTWTRRP